MEMECVLRDLTERLAPPRVPSDRPPNDSSNRPPPPNPTGHTADGGVGGLDGAEADVAAAAVTEQMTHQVTMVRINPQFPQNPGLEARTIAIRGTAEATLREIDRAMLHDGRP